jgi:branched-chain amino acid transport system substrate-binding protein
MIKAGILLPRSTLFPTMAMDLLQVCKISLKEQYPDEEFRFFIDHIGFATDEKEVYGKAEKMLLQEDIDVLILCADTRYCELLNPLFMAAGKLLLVVNFGANIPENWFAGENSLVHSLNFSFHTYLTGKRAALGETKQAAYAVSYYEGGYRQCTSLLNSHQQNGGIPCYVHVTHIQTEEFTLKPLAEYLVSHPEVKNLLCLFSADMAALFYKNVMGLQQQHSLRLWVSPMMLDRSVKDWYDGPMQVSAASGYTGWFEELPIAQNDYFKKRMEEEGKKANLFSLLGWETGILLAALAKQYKAAGNWARALSGIAGQQLGSPRGWIQLDARTHHVYSPAHLVHCEGDLHCALQEELTGAALESEWAAYTALKILESESSSWKNNYLCI